MKLRFASSLLLQVFVKPRPTLLVLESMGFSLEVKSWAYGYGFSYVYRRQCGLDLPGDRGITRRVSGAECFGDRWVIGDC